MKYVLALLVLTAVAFTSYSYGAKRPKVEGAVNYLLKCEGNNVLIIPKSLFKSSFEEI